MNKIFEEFVSQARRLFSSKSNGSNLIYSTTDRMHKYKIILLGIGVFLLIGYSQFRDHFQCQTKDNVDPKALSNFCWINGTTTLDLIKDPERNVDGNSSEDDSGSAPHVGIHFRLNDGKYEVITHNYMHSIWTLLLLLALCSILARRYRSSIFSRESLVALLKLPGHDKLDSVKRVQANPPYLTLLRVRDQRRIRSSGASTPKQPADVMDQLNNLMNVEKSFCETFIKMSEENEDNLSLDYYVNQLLHLLLANSSTAYKISGLKLKCLMIKYQIISISLTCLQFILARLFIGRRYTIYGWLYMRAWLDYISNQLFDPTGRSIEPNRVGYEISAQIWPTTTQCEYEQFGYHGIERMTVQCHVSINEICAKLFAIIWWLFAVSLVIELWSLCTLILTSLTYNITRYVFGFRCWPNAYKEASMIANFRYDHNLLMSRLTSRNFNFSASAESLNDNGIENSIDISRERKRLEAADGRGSGHSRASHFWFVPSLGKKSSSYETDSNLISSKTYSRNNRSKLDENGFREKRNDVNILFLLHLLYLRLKCSSKKTQLVIRATYRALLIYSDTLRDCLNKHQENAADRTAIQLAQVEPIIKPESTFQVSQA